MTYDELMTAIFPDIFPEGQEIAREHITTVLEQRERHAEKEAALTDAINSMTVAVERLTTKLEDNDHDL